MSFSKRLGEEGQGLVEYALILVLVAVVVIVVLAATGNQIQTVFCDVVIKLGGTASDNIKACVAPRVTIEGVPGGTVSGHSQVTVEALVQNNKGSTGQNIASVDFYIDGSMVHSENVYHYCLGGGDASCSPYTLSLSPGQHTIRVVATDSSGNTGESSATFTTN